MGEGFWRQRLAEALGDVVAEDASARGASHEEDRQACYVRRNRAVMKGLHFASKAGIACGVRFDPAEPEWPVVYFALPDGQVSFHVPQFAEAFDGHSKADVLDRVVKFAEREGLV